MKYLPILFIDEFSIESRFSQDRETLGWTRGLLANELPAKALIDPEAWSFVAVHQYDNYNTEDI